MEDEVLRVDFNAHILVNPFDNIKTLQASFSTLEHLTSLGFTKVLATPRFLPSKTTYASVPNLRKQVKELGIAATYHGLHVSLGLTSEIFITPTIPSLIFSGTVLPLEKTKLLIRLPDSDKVSIEKLTSVLRALTLRHYTPIIATPERCAILQKHPDSIKSISSLGVMFQCSYKSIAGLHGHPTEKLALWMLREGYCDFLGTEASNPDDPIFTKFAKAEKKILSLIGEDAYKKIMRNANGIF